MQTFDTTVQVLPADASNSRDVRAAEQTTAGYGNGVLRVQAPAKNRVLGLTALSGWCWRGCCGEVRRQAGPFGMMS